MSEEFLILTGKIFNIFVIVVNIFLGNEHLDDTEYPMEHVII